MIPSFEAAETELREIAAGVADAGGGLLQIVLNAGPRTWKEEMGTAIGLAKASGLPLTFSKGTGRGLRAGWRQLQ